MHYGKKILEFMVGNFKIYTGFGNYKQAEEFAKKPMANSQRLYIMTEK